LEEEEAGRQEQFSYDLDGNLFCKLNNTLLCSAWLRKPPPLSRKAEREKIYHHNVNSNIDLIANVKSQFPRRQ
jgi:hypothetical protein